MESPKEIFQQGDVYKFSSTGVINVTNGWYPWSRDQMQGSNSTLDQKGTDKILTDSFNDNWTASNHRQGQTVSCRAYKYLIFEGEERRKQGERLKMRLDWMMRNSCIALSPFFCTWCFVFSQAISCLPQHAILAMILHGVLPLAKQCHAYLRMQSLQWDFAVHARQRFVGRVQRPWVHRTIAGDSK